MRQLRQISAPRKQAGFIQNFIIPGILLIGAVIAGIAAMSSSSSTSVDNEKAAMSASAVISQGLTVTSAIQRAEADGSISTAAAVMATADLKTALIDTKYLAGAAMPSPSTESGATSWSYDKKHLVVGSVGTTDADDVLYASLGTSAMSKAMCLRVNNKLHGTSSLPSTTIGGAMDAASLTQPTGAAVGATEGCIDNAGDYTYFRVINVR